MKPGFHLCRLANGAPISEPCSRLSRQGVCRSRSRRMPEPEPEPEPEPGRASRIQGAAGLSARPGPSARSSSAPHGRQMLEMGAPCATCASAIADWGQAFGKCLPRPCRVGESMAGIASLQCRWAGQRFEKIHDAGLLYRGRHQRVLRTKTVVVDLSADIVAARESYCGLSAAGAVKSNECERRHCVFWVATKIGSENIDLRGACGASGAAPPPPHTALASMAVARLRAVRSSMRPVAMSATRRDCSR